MTRHASKIKLGHARIEPFESGSLTEFNPPVLNPLSYILNPVVVGNVDVVAVLLKYATGIRSDQVLLQSPQILFARDKPQEHGFQAGRSCVVFFVWIRRRCDYSIDGAIGQESRQLPCI